MNDKTKGSRSTDSTAQVWDPQVPVTARPRLDVPVARYSALGVPATFLAVGESSENIGGQLLGGVAELGGTLITQQPLLATVIALAVGGAGYMFLKENAGRGGDGFATRRQVHKVLGRRPLVHRRSVLRPSLAEVPARQVPGTAVGAHLGRCRKTGVEAYSAIEDSTLMLAPMGAGKTAKLGHWLLDAPGAVLATTTKYDLVEWTEKVRAQRGRVQIWNPQGLAGRPSTVAVDPVVGCADPEHGIDRCMRRALYLLEGSDATKGLENRTFWMTSSYKVLKAFLWAAAADGRSLLDVARWSKKPHDKTAIELFKKYETQAPVGWREDLEQAQEVKGKPTTMENVFGTLAQTFMFLDSPRVQKIITAAHRPGAEVFDPAVFLTSTDTLYLLGRDDSLSGVGPLFTVLTGEIYETARMLASRNVGGRMDPPTTFVLDEAALICSVPLQRWTADSRGLGLTVHSVFQSPAQIHERWGKFAYQTIWDNCTKLIMGGLSNEEHIEAISKACGPKWVKEPTYSSSTPGGGGARNSSSSWRWVEKRTMRPEEVTNLDPGEILVLRKHLKAPVVVRFVPVWERKDVKELKKAIKKKNRNYRRSPKEAGADQDVPAGAPGLPAGEPSAPPEDVSRWTADPAASGWADNTGGFPGPRNHLRLLPGEVVDPADSAPPERPAHAPTVHLEDDETERPAAAPQESPEPLRKTGTDKFGDDMGTF